MKKSFIIGVIFLLIGCEKNEPIIFQKIEPISSVEPFQDIRFKDLTNIENQLDSDMIRTLKYNEKTVWPLSYERYADEIMEMGKDPGLGIRSIHALGITGQNVNVAIIDQNLCADYHPEYTDNIVEYFDTGCNTSNTKGSNHGPSVVSLLVGKTLGVAPDAKVYYVAAPTWTGDAKFIADGLDWIVKKNSELPVDQKIRVVSVSAGPSGEGSPFTKNRELWDQAYQRAVDSNILVLDCTSHHRLNSACYYDIFNRNDITKCLPGWPDSDMLNPDSYKDVICTPSSLRTAAEQYDKGDYSFSYSGKAGVSWSVPYLAGVIALGWQVNPDLSSEQITDYIFETAYIYNGYYRIINPVAFIEKITNNR
jgi:subtilisin family serine protease